MNRAQRRRARRQRAYLDSLAGRRLTNTDSCPDCNADVQVVKLARGVYRLTVLHDATCPTYQAMTEGDTTR